MARTETPRPPAPVPDLRSRLGGQSVRADRGLVQGNYPLPGRTGSVRSGDGGSPRVRRIARLVLGATDRPRHRDGRPRHRDGRRHGRLHGRGVVHRHVNNGALHLPWPAVRPDRVRPWIRPVDRRASWTILTGSWVAGGCLRVRPPSRPSRRSPRAIWSADGRFRSQPALRSAWLSR